MPAVVESALPEGVVRRRQGKRTRPVPSVIIEVEIEGVSVRVGRGADVKTLEVVIRGAEGRHLIGPTGTVRLMMATKPLNFRKGRVW